MAGAGIHTKGQRSRIATRSGADVNVGIFNLLLPEGIYTPDVFLKTGATFGFVLHVFLSCRRRG